MGRPNLTNLNAKRIMQTDFSVFHNLLIKAKFGWKERNTRRVYTNCLHTVTFCFSVLIIHSYYPVDDKTDICIF